MTLADGAVLTVRPIEPERRRRGCERMFYRLSPDDRVPPLLLARSTSPPHRMLLWLTNVDHDRREALVALARRRDRGRRPLRRPARHRPRPRSPSRSRTPGSTGASGLRLARRLAAAALDHGFEAFIATMLADNRPALGLLRKLSPDASRAVRRRQLRGVAPLPASS